jgi:type IV fimbrial biogenesis protein FimT
VAITAYSYPFASVANHVFKGPGRPSQTRHISLFPPLPKWDQGGFWCKFLNSRRWRDGGYTLLELVTVLAIVAVASAMAYPALAGLRRGQQLESAAVGLVQKLRLARWRAVVTGTRVRVTPLQLADGAWRFRVEREQGAAWVPDGDEQSIPRGTVVAVAGATEKVFNPDGTCGLGSITLRGVRGEVYRCTLAPATGRVRFYRGDREAGRGL